MRHLAARRSVPRWVVENYARPRSRHACTTSHTRHTALTDVSAVYLVDGPTFPIGDGGSAVKATFMEGLATRGVKLGAIAADWRLECSEGYTMRGVDVRWFDPEHYFDAALRGAIADLPNAPAVIVDSYETLRRLASWIDPDRLWLLMLDDYAETHRLRAGARAAQAVARGLQQAMNAGLNLLYRSSRDVLNYDTTRCGHVAPFTGVRTAPAIQPKVSGPIAMVANFRYPPNLDGLAQLLDSGWPPDLPLRLIGDIAAQDAQVLRQLPLSLDFLGRVDDLGEALTGCAIGIDPSLVGSGTSTKVLTYFSFGLPVVCTQFALRGLAAAQDVAIACTTTHDLIAAVQRLRMQPHQLDALGRRARQLMSQHFDVEGELDAICHLLQASK